MNPNDPNAIWLLSLNTVKIVAIENIKGDKRDAMLKEVISLLVTIDSVKALTLLGSVHAMMGSKPKAIEAFERAIALGGQKNLLEEYIKKVKEE